MLLSCTFLYTFILLAFALTIPIIRAAPYSKSTHVSISALSTSHQQVRPSARTAGGPGRLRARGPGDQVGHPASLMHTMKKVPGTFKALATVEPVQQAAAAMQDFWLHLYEKAVITWSSQPRHRAFSYDKNGYNIIMSAMGDTIPWEFVQEFAQTGWELANRGLTSLFDIMYANADGKIMVSISFRMLHHAIPELSGSGAGDSSQTAEDWREGSVPSVGTGADANLNGMNWGGGMH